MKYAVIGLGDFGRAVAVGLARGGAEVIAIDKKMDRLDMVKDEVALAVQLDSTHPEALKAQGIQDVEFLVAAIGQNFEAQILTVVHAKRFGIPNVIARASTEAHRRVLEAVGADQVFYPEEEAARSLVQRLTLSNIKNYFELADGFSLVEVKPPAKAVGKTLRGLNLRSQFRLNIVAIKHFKTGPDAAPIFSGFDPVPSPDEVVQEQDILVLVGSVLDLAHFLGTDEDFR